MPLLIVCGLPSSGKTEFSLHFEAYINKELEREREKNAVGRTLDIKTGKEKEEECQHQRQQEQQKGEDVEEERKDLGEKNNSTGTSTSSDKGKRNGENKSKNKLYSKWLDKIENVIVVNEEKLNIRKDEGYLHGNKEKMTRSNLKAFVDRFVNNPRTLVILDSLNYIKGYRYELFCLARQYNATRCLAWVQVVEEEENQYQEEAQEEEGKDGNKNKSKTITTNIDGEDVKIIKKEVADICYGWNTNRTTGLIHESNIYPNEIYYDLLNRFEPPNPKNRWDNPLVKITNKIQTKAIHRGGNGNQSSKESDIILSSPQNTSQSQVNHIPTLSDTTTDPCINTWQHLSDRRHAQTDLTQKELEQNPLSSQNTTITITTTRQGKATESSSFHTIPNEGRDLQGTASVNSVNKGKSMSTSSFKKKGSFKKKEKKKIADLNSLSTSEFLTEDALQNLNLNNNGPIMNSQEVIPTSQLGLEVSSESITSSVQIVSGGSKEDSSNIANILEDKGGDNEAFDSENEKLAGNVLDPETLVPYFEKILNLLTENKANKKTMATSKVRKIIDIMSKLKKVNYSCVNSDIYFIYACM